MTLITFSEIEVVHKKQLETQIRLKISEGPAAIAVDFRSPAAVQVKIETLDANYDIPFALFTGRKAKRVSLRVVNPVKEGVFKTQFIQHFE